MNELQIRLIDGTMILVPASLHAITTYVLLEQEAWFEKETAFVPRLMKPGMVAIDIGANLGVYSLLLARRLAGTGAVYAYEPGSEPRTLLTRSMALNDIGNLHVIADAVSDRPRQGRLRASWSSELHSLGEDGEPVGITSLDEEDRLRNWGSPDFIKIDAEGEEMRILEGGGQFFARHSPLVMFEVRAGGDINRALLDAFRARGYRLFRLLPGAPILVPVESGDTIDAFELNLFAAKPDRIAGLAKEGWLAESVPKWSPDETARRGAMRAIEAEDFGPALSALSYPAYGSLYGDALAAYAAWRNASSPPALRYGALRYGHAAMLQLCAAEPHLAWLSTLARMQWDIGERQASIASLKQILDAARQRSELQEPFWPCNPRFDGIAPGQDVGRWFLVAAAEQLERASSHSSIFGSEGLQLEWLAAQPFAATEILRRHILKQALTGERVTVPERLRQPAADHANFDLWRAGLVHNTLVSAP